MRSVARARCAENDSHRLSAGVLIKVVHQERIIWQHWLQKAVVFPRGATARQCCSWVATRCDLAPYVVDTPDDPVFVQAPLRDIFPVNGCEYDLTMAAHVLTGQLRIPRIPSIYMSA